MSKSIVRFTKGSMNAEKLFYTSALSFVMSFVLYSATSYFHVEAGSAAALNLVAWVLSIAGVVIFLFGLLARKR